MFPWRRILIPTDFSTASTWVFDDAVRIAGSTGAEIVILHIRMTWSAHPDELRFPADPALYDYAERIELEKLRDRVKRSNAAIATSLLVKSAPDPGAEIARTAKSEAIDLVVMSTHARHHVAHLLLGSTTREVITKTGVPLLAIRYGIHTHSSLQRIVIPVHAKQHSEAALDLAAAIAARQGAELHLLTVCNESERTAATEFLDALSEKTKTKVAKSVVAGDDVEREVVRYTQKADADAIFVNAADAPSPLKIEIVRKAPVPVMIVPA
ncbi:MAG TPA: universal stress protein [Thermoanaerobaculia bacterium]|nr:universal stress protein [Thermoanaerobaculia bacterium]